MPLDFPTGVPVNYVHTVGGKSWRWNGKGWESQTISVLGTISGTPNEVQITGTNEAGYTIGLPSHVRLTDGGFRANYFNVGEGGTFTANLGGVSLSSGLGIAGNLNISGSLVVDGPIVSKSGFSGFTLDGDIEPITDVSLDGGEF